MDYFERTISSEYIYKGKIVNLRKDTVELSEGKSGVREVVEHEGAAAVIPITNQKEIILVEQYRKAPDKRLLEIPAGKLENGENPKNCALRELQEEIGKGARKLYSLLHFYPSPGFCSEVIYLFAALDLYESKQNQDFDEVFKIHTFSLHEAVEMTKKGIINDAKTVIGIYTARDFVHEYF